VLRRDYWSEIEDGRPAKNGEFQIAAGGEKFWVLRVNLWQDASWPTDCVTRLLIWERTDGTLEIENGRFWPEQEEDGA
jgi:hypothetical protein